MRLRQIRSRRFPLEAEWLLSERGVGLAAALILAGLVLGGVVR